MAHKNIDINLSFKQATADWLEDLAKQENKTVEDLAKELILQDLRKNSI